MSHHPAYPLTLDEHSSRLETTNVVQPLQGSVVAYPWQGLAPEGAVSSFGGGDLNDEMGGGMPGGGSYQSSCPLTCAYVTLPYSGVRQHQDEVD